jgi:para-aminobenzoate synthetase component I
MPGRTNHMIDTMNHYGSEKIPFLFIIDYDMRKPVVLPLDDVSPDEILYNINGMTNAGNGGCANRRFSLRAHPVSYDVYEKAFARVREYELSGDSYLCNLTFPTPIDLDLPLIDVFHESAAPYRLWYKNEFVVFSPEPFVTIRGLEISSYPMKGTIDAAVAGAEEIILGDEKEHAEHTTIVDLIRNDLNRVAARVTVEKFRYVERIEASGRELLQVSSKITGRLDPGYRARLGDIIASMLPAGSVTGAPKKRTTDIIREVEGYDRGYYTGIFGYYDGEALDSGVMIRFIESKDGALYYKSGGGITVYSDAGSEYRELIDKIYVPIV